jgi:hypothetical protein
MCLVGFPWSLRRYMEFAFAVCVCMMGYVCKRFGVLLDV